MTIFLMFPLNRLYTFYTSDITPFIPRRMSHAKVKDSRSIEQTYFQCIYSKIVDCFNDISLDS